MHVGSLTSAAHRALGGINQVFARVEDVAETVAAGVVREDGSTADALGAIAQLPMLRMQARANAKVFATVEELLSDLAGLPRR